MDRRRIEAKTALSLRKAGYRLFSLSSGEKTFFFLDGEGNVFVYDEKKERRLSPYLFLSLYETSLFERDGEQEEETVDRKKDEEYYSWRQ